MKIRLISISMVTAGALLASGLLLAPAANASSTPAAPSEAAASLETITPDQLDRAIQEAQALGYAKSQTTNADGSKTTRLDLGHGFEFDVTQENPRARLSAGSDSYGAYVSFNATDQSLIINGATWGISAGLCVLSAGVFCVVVGAILTVAGTVLTGNGAIRCGTKGLRVYPFSGHKPRCA